LKNLPQKMGGNFYKNIASYGHFGREDLSLPWEDVDDKATLLASIAKKH